MADRKPKTNKNPWDFHLMEGMVDSHFHSAVMRQKGMDTHFILKHALSSGLSGGIDIGLTPDDFPERSAASAPFPGIHLSAGCYPSDVEKKTVHELITGLKDLLVQEKEIAAIGEIGLDWHWNYGTRQAQKELFKEQLVLAKEFNLPVIIHNREADSDVLDILSSIHLPRGGILHCFSSDYNTAKKILDRGFLISFAGNLTYKRNVELRDTAMKVPIDRILMETDSPYLSPQKRRGSLNHPGHIGYTYESMAAIKNMEIHKLIQQIKSNFNGLFSISEE